MELSDWAEVLVYLRKEFLKIFAIIITTSSLFFIFGANFVIRKVIDDLFPAAAVMSNKAKLIAIGKKLQMIGQTFINYANHPSQTNLSSAIAASKELVRLATELTTTPILIHPLEGLLLNLKLSFSVGVAVALPYILYVIYKALKERGVVTDLKFTKSTAFKYAIASVCLFIAGVIYGYNMMHFFVRFLYILALKQGAVPLYSLQEFVNFVILMLSLFGLVFEMPVIMYFLVKNGFVKYETLCYYRRHIYVAFFVIGAITTPPDVFTQLMVAVPMVVFFEISLLFVRIFAKPEQSKSEQSSPAQS